MTRTTLTRPSCNRRRRLGIERLERRDVMASTPLTLTPYDSSIDITQAAVVGQAIAGADGVQSFSVNLAAGQRLAVVASVVGTPLTVSFVNPLGLTLVTNTASPGWPVALTPYMVTIGGTWTINVSAPVGKSGAFTLEVAVNSGFEYADTSVAKPQAMDASFITTAGVGRWAWIGTATGTADVDQYSINMAGRAGKAFDFTLVGSAGTNFSGQTLQLIAPDGVTVVATASPYTPQGQTPALRISGFTVASGIYSLRFSSAVPGKYLLAVSDTAIPGQTNASQVLNLLVTNRLTTQTSVSGLLGTLTFDRVFQSMSSDEVLAALLRVGAINGYSNLATLKAALPSRGVDLANLRADGVLSELAVATYGNLLTSVQGPAGAIQAKNMLLASFNADRLGFVGLFTTAELIGLFDDSITTSSSSARDQFFAFVSQGANFGAANVVKQHQLWVHDGIRVNSPTPLDSYTTTNLLAPGTRVIHIADFAQVTGYGLGTYPTIGYLDPVDAAGNPAQYYTIWMDQWAVAIKNKITTFFTQYKALGGQLDMLVMDIESVGMDYFRLRTVDHRVNPNSTPTQSVFQAIMADPRWPAVKDQLLKAGLTETALSSIATWVVGGTEAAIWNAVMQNRLANYLNTAIYQPIKQLYPTVPVSNYGHYLHTPTVASGSIAALTQSPYTIGTVVGNTQAVDLYGYSQGIYTGGDDSIRFQTGVAKFTFTQNTDGLGNPLASGIVRADFGFAMTGVKAGDKVTITNAGNQPLDARYTGTFTVLSISSDFKSITYALQLASPTNKPANYTYTGSPLNPAIANFWTSYKALVADVKLLRTQVATSNVPFTPWVTSPNWLQLDQGLTHTYYPELLLHAGLSGAENFLWWKSTMSADQPGALLISKLLSELDSLVGYADRKTLSRTDVSFTDGSILTGMEAGGKRVYRLTPDPSQAVTVLSSSGTVRIQIGSQIVTIANASIYTPPSPASTLGFWIVQTQGSSQLVGGVSQVLSQLTGLL
jgi:hypothetical protein